MKRHNPKAQVVWVYVHVRPAGCPLGTNCMSCHVRLSACLFDWLCHTVRISRCEQPACSVSCAYIYFRELDGREWHTRTRQRERKRKRYRQAAATLHSDWVQPIIQCHVGAETPGIDSQAKGQRDRDTQTAAAAATVQMIHALCSNSRFYTPWIRF